MSERADLLKLMTAIALVRGKVTLSSGREADWYLDMRRITLHHEGAPLVGRLLRSLTEDWEYEAVGGLTLGADPIAAAMMLSAGRPLDAFVVRKEAKAHGMQRQVEGPDVAGRRVLAVEDTSTTGSSVLAAVSALRVAGAAVVGVAVVVDRGARSVVEAARLPYRALYSLTDLGLE